MTVQELSQSLKNKYPEYEGYDDQVLVDALVKKYPEYGDYLTGTPMSGQTFTPMMDIPQAWKDTRPGEDVENVPMTGSWKTGPTRTNVDELLVAPSPKEEVEDVPVEAVKGLHVGDFSYMDRITVPTNINRPLYEIEAEENRRKTEQVLKESENYDLMDSMKDLASNPKQLIPFLGSATELKHLGAVVIIANKLDKDEELTLDEYKALNQFITESERRPTFLAGTFEIIKALPSFFGEMGAGKLIFTGAKKGGTALLSKMLSKSFKAKVKAGLTKKPLVGKISEKTAETAVKTGVVSEGGVLVGGSRVDVGEVERNLQEWAQGDQDYKDIESIHGDDHRSQSRLDMAIEVLSEQSGGLFRKAFKGIRKGAKDLMVKRGLYSTLVSKNPGKEKIIKQAFESMGYHGVLEEMMEERLGEALRGIAYEMGVDDEGFKYELPTLKQLAQEFVAFSVPGGAQKLATKISEVDIKQKRDKLNNKFKDNKAWQEVQKYRTTKDHDPEVAEMAEHFIQQNPDLGETSVLQITNQAKKITREELEKRGETFEQFGLDSETEVADIAGSTEYKMFDGIRKVLIQLNKRADHTTVVEEFYGYFYKSLSPQDQAVWDEYYKSQETKLSSQELFEKEGVNYFYATQKAKNLPEKIFKKLKELFTRILGTQPKEIQDLYKRAGKADVRAEGKVSGESYQLKELFDTSKRVYGTTEDIKEVGYILPDGSMLDFSGKREGGTPGMRSYDHRQMYDIADEERGGDPSLDKYADMESFMGAGAIRFGPESNFFDMTTKPDYDQLVRMRKISEDVDGEVIVEASKGTKGRDDRFYREYEKHTPWEEIKRDLLQFYRSGRGPSLAQQFHRSYQLVHEVAKKVKNPRKISDSRKVSVGTRRGLEDIMATLEDPDFDLEGSIEWYRDKVERALSVATIEVPAISESYHNRVFTEAILAITSHGTKIKPNYHYALGIVDRYFKGEGFNFHKNPQGNEVIRTLNDKDIEVTAGGAKSPSVAKNIRKIDLLIEKLGYEGAMDWLVTPHTGSEIKNMFEKKPSGHLRLGSTYYGAESLGPKIGRYLMNLHGVHEEAVYDVWFTRTWNRWMGTPFKVVGGKIAYSDKGVPLIQDQPRGNIERDLMDQTVKNIREKLSEITGHNFGADQIQALLWYYEKELYIRHGSQQEKGTNYLDVAVDRAKEKGYYEQLTTSENNKSLKGIKGRRDVVPRKQEEDSPGDKRGVERPREKDEQKDRQKSYQLKPFYSKAIRAVEKPKFGKSRKIQGIIPYLKNQGVSDEEIKWMGVDQFVESMPQKHKSVTQKDLLDLLSAMEISIEEVELGKKFQYRFDNSDDYYDAIRRAERDGDFDFSEELTREVEAFALGHGAGRTLYHNYTLPGGQNYRELLLRPTRGIPALNRYRGRHFKLQDYDNIIAHVRFNTRFDEDGNKVLFIEEVQSDWHQEGKKKRYIPPAPPKSIQDEHKALDKRWGKLNQEVMILEKRRSTQGYYETKDKWDADQRRLKVLMKKWDKTNDELTALEEQYPGLVESDGVPDAPYKGDGWMKLALKRMLRYGAENGFDKIAWTTGKQQADRYQLRKYINRIEYIKPRPTRKQQSLAIPVNRYEVKAFDKKGEQVFRKLLKESELESYVGKDVARRMVEGKGEVREGVVSSKLDKDTGGTVGVAGEIITLKGLDLHQGGEGMSVFYDQKIPGFLRKYIKQWGGKVGTAKISKGWVAYNRRTKEYMPEVFPTKSQAIRASFGIPSLEVRKNSGVLTQPSVDITPEMKESVMQGQTSFQLKGFELEKESFREMVERKLVDSLNRLKKVQTAIGDVSEDEDAYMKAELYIGKASEKIDVFRDEIEVFVKELVDDGNNLGDFGNYLYALHAKERNASLKERFPDRWDEDSSPSGMSDSEAQNIIKNSDPRLKDFEKKFRKDVIQKRLKNLFDAGMITQETYDLFSSKEVYGNYVPLKGISEKESMMGIGQGFSTSGKDIKRAYGRSSKAKNPFIQALVDFEESIIRIEKNEVGKALLNLVENNPNEYLWEAKGLRHKPVYDKDGEIEFMQPDQLRDNQVAVHIDGKTKVITIHDEKLVSGIKKVGMTRGIPLLTQANAYFRAINTYYNPEFLITNFSRDLQTANIHLSGEKGTKLAGKVTKSIPGAMKGIWRESRGKKGNEWSKWYRRFKSQGGRMGWFDEMTVEEKSARLERQINRLQKQGKYANALRATANLIEDMNEAVESAVRLSAFRTLVESGASEEKSAQFAKNLTVNFNKKGELGSFMNSLWLFSNASIQGTARIWRSLKHKRTRQIAMGIAVTGFIQSFINRLIDPEDWEQYNDYDKDNYWIFMLPNGKSVSIKLPYGWNVFKVLGSVAEEVTMGEVRPEEGASRIVGAVSDAFNPLGSGSVGQFLSPTVADPVVQVVENKNFFGGPIKPEQPPFGQPRKPDSQLYFKSVRKQSKAVTDWLNKNTGGSDQVSGFVDISPEVVDHYIDALGGGTAKFVANTMETGTQLSKGDFPEIRNVPVLRQFIKEPSEYSSAQVVRDMFAESKRTIYSDQQVKRFKRNLDYMRKNKLLDWDKYKNTYTKFMKNQSEAKTSYKKAS